MSLLPRMILTIVSLIRAGHEESLLGKELPKDIGVEFVDISCRW